VLYVFVISVAVVVFSFVVVVVVVVQVPNNAQAGNYTLRLEGSVNEATSAGYIFENETKLIFDSKQVSIFIEISKGLYMQGQEGEHTKGRGVHTPPHSPPSNQLGSSLHFCKRGKYRRSERP